MDRLRACPSKGTRIYLGRAIRAIRGGNLEGWKLEPLTSHNSALLLIDYQPAMFKGVGMRERTILVSASVAISKAASILGVPVVLTSITPSYNGEFLKEITDLFPGQKALARKVPGFDALEDEEVMAALRKTGRKKIVISGLWTSMCFAFTAIHAIREGFEVYGLIDAAGDASRDAHKFGIKRMLQVGVVPVTTLQVISEWMHDWDNPKSGELIKEAYSTLEPLLGM